MLFQHRIDGRRGCRRVRAAHVERQLMARIAAGDRAAFAELYDRIAPSVFALALQHTASHEDAERRTHRVLVEIWRTAARYDPAQGSPLSWAHRRWLTPDPHELGWRSERAHPCQHLDTHLLAPLDELSQLTGHSLLTTRARIAARDTQRPEPARAPHAH